MNDPLKPINKGNASKMTSTTAKKSKSPAAGSSQAKEEHAPANGTTAETVVAQNAPEPVPRPVGASASSSSQPSVAPVEKPKIDASRWVIVYPPYIDKSKTIQQGRRVPSNAAIRFPHVIEIFKVLAESGWQCVLELNKSYSRDFLSRGRVRVRLFDDTHKPIRSEVPNRKQLLLVICQAMPAWREKNGSMEKHADPMNLITTGVTKTNLVTSSAVGSDHGKGSSSSGSKKGKGKR